MKLSNGSNSSSSSSNNNKNNKSIACKQQLKHLTQSCIIKWRSCESTKVKQYKCYRQILGLVKLCNYILFSCVVLFGGFINGIVGGSSSSNDGNVLGCSSNPCVFGVCIDEINGTYNCYCIDGYTGKQCQTNWDECWSLPCLNGGTCIDGVAAYNCTCPEGFSGVNCEENLDECLSNPCQNSGTCDDRENGYVCYCAAGYAGVHCEVDVAVCNTGNGNKCHNGGLCVEGVGLDFTCDCAAGWKGRFCSIEIDECESSPCQNGGICVDKIAAYACICPVGFTGPNCEEDIQVCNDSPCENSALCLMEEGSPVCYCVPDFHGEKCEYQYDECQIGPRCANGGMCIDGVDDFTCSCKNGFKGMFCECLEQSNGELNCNYTAMDRTTPKFITMPTTDASSSSTTSKTKVFTSTSEEMSSSPSSQMPTDLPSVYTSTITQSVPTDVSFMTSTVEVLDLSKSTEEISSTTEISTDSTTTTDISSSSPLYTTKLIPKTTQKHRPCPPDALTTTRLSSTTIKSIIDTTTESELSSSSSPSSTFHYDSTSYASTITPIQSTDGNTQSTLTTTTVSTADEQSSSYSSDGTTTTTEAYSTSTSSEQQQQHSTGSISTSTTSSSSDIESTSEMSLETTIGISMTTLIEGGTSTSLEYGKSSTLTSTTTTAIDDYTQSTTSLSETPLKQQTTTQMTLQSSSYQPPLSTEDMFTLSPSDVGNMTDCRSLKCYNGGSCVVTSEGAKCVCRFDRQDPNCRTLIKIRNAAFGGDSYLSHLIYSDNHADFDVKPLDSILPINIELKARTRATDGLILVAIAQGSKGGHYTALFLHKGLLQFQFSCGLQTMLLSELEAPINNGNEFTIQVALDFSRNHSHCNASLRINDTLAMSGDQPTWLGAKTLGSKKTVSNVWLHLGGSPQTPVVLMSGLPNGQGFSGCLHTLRINDEAKEIFRDAYDGFGISECGSLACLSNPCKNGGTCEERYYEQHEDENDINNKFYEKTTMMIEHRWQCKCPTGYLGLSCERSVCENNPCQFGGTCVEFPGSGYLCLCPVGKHGHYCEHSLDIDQPSFSGSVNGLSSYISYPVPIPLESTLDLSFKIAPATSSQISLLAFIGQHGSHDEKSDHLAVSFIQGYIMLTWNLGNGPRRIFTEHPLIFQDPEDEIISYQVQVIRQGRTASLYIDGKLNVTGNSPGDVSRLDVVPTLYIGGHAATNFSTLPHDLPLHSGFQGCIYDLQLKSGSLVVPLHDTKGITGRSVGQCGTRECHRHSCHNNGACLQHGATFTCICADGWFGTLCSQRMNPCDSGNSKCASESTCVPLINGYECDCPLGKMGKYCEIAIKYLSDVSLSGKRSYFALGWHNHSQANLIPRDRYKQQLRMNHDVDVFSYDSSSKLMARNIMEHQRKAQLLSVEFQLRPLSETGLLLFLGNLDEPDDGFISLSLNGGVIEFRISGQGQNQQLSIVRSNRVLAIGEWHKIRLSQNGRRLSLWVEGSSTSNELKPNSIFYHNSNSLIYIGGLTDLSKLPYNSVSGFPIPFKGCVRQFYLNGHRYVLNEQTIVDSRNIVDCDGTACGGDACDQGGNCYLDDKHNPHCKCPETAKGIHCEIPESCHVIKCKNGGKCMPNGECSCPNGWTGYFCEIATNRFSLPSFNGKSYMIVPSQRLTHSKDKRNGPASSRLQANKFLQISLNFSTINLDGMLLWNDNKRKFLGIGLENGFLKIVSNILNFKDDEIDVPTGGYLTDGAWHNIKLDIDEQGQMTVAIDRKIVYNQVRNVASNLDSLGDSFYLGGFPNNMTISNRTLNHFHKPFSGCLQGIQITNINNRLISNSQKQSSSSSSSSKNIQQTPSTSYNNIQDFSSFEGENIGECEFFDEFVNSYDNKL